MNYPYVRVGRNFLHMKVKDENRGVIVPPSGAPECPEPKSVWVGVLL